MVKHPKYQAQDDAREVNIPIYFEKYFKSNKDLSLVRINPPNMASHVPGPKPRPTFRIKNTTQNKFVAELHPNGKYDLFDKIYKGLFEEMVQKIETKAQQALLEYEREFG